MSPVPQRLNGPLATTASSTGSMSIAADPAAITTAAASLLGLGANFKQQMQPPLLRGGIGGVPTSAAGFFQVSNFPRPYFPLGASENGLRCSKIVIGVARRTDKIDGIV